MIKCVLGSSLEWKRLNLVNSSKFDKRRRRQCDEAREPSKCLFGIRRRSEMRFEPEKYKVVVEGRLIPTLKHTFGSVNSDSVNACLLGIAVVVDEVKFHVFVGDLSAVGEFEGFNRRLVGVELKFPEVEGLLVLRVHSLAKRRNVD
jgi:hypothetical protein